MAYRLAEIGSLFEARRREKGLTQEALGRTLGVGRSQISKIESGKGLTFTTINKVAGALGADVIVSLKEPQRNDRDVIEYTIFAIGEFSRRHNLSRKEAAGYLIRFGGIGFLQKCYEAEHTLSIDDCIDDLTAICHNNGGGLT